MYEDVLNEILESIRRTEAKVDAMAQAHNTTVEQINHIVTEVQPHLSRVGEMLDQVQKHPMARMLGMGK